MASPLAWLQSEDMDYGVIAAFAGFLLIILGLHYLDVTQSTVFAWIFALAPIWLPILTFSIFFYKYMSMVGLAFYLYCGRRTYEVIMPQEVFKSPEAMEAVFTQLFNKATPDNLMETYLTGKRPQTFSFEIVSRGGEVKFYINLPIKKGSRMLEPAFYSQYPGIELKELPVDYTAEISHDLKGKFAMAFHMTKGDPQALPIKTYIDAKLQDLPKEEEKVDPLNQLIEFMSAIRPYEQMWVQILCTAHRDQSFKNGQLRKKPTWEKEVHAEIDKILRRDPETKANLSSGIDRLTTGERDTVEAMERNVSKPAFETAIRWMYISEPGKGDGDFFAGMLRGFAAFDYIGRNKIGPKWRTDFNYKFLSDPFGTRIAAWQKQELKEYKLRKLFPKNTVMGTKIFTTEELATIWHPVGTATLTPALNRVTSAKSKAPGNLPTG